MMFELIAAAIVAAFVSLSLSDSPGLLPRFGGNRTACAGIEPRQARSGIDAPREGLQKREMKSPRELSAAYPQSQKREI